MACWRGPPVEPGSTRPSPRVSRRGGVACLVSSRSICAGSTGRRTTTTPQPGSSISTLGRRRRHPRDPAPRPQRSVVGRPGSSRPSCCDFAPRSLRRSWSARASRWLAYGSRTPGPRVDGAHGPTFDHVTPSAGRPGPEGETVEDGACLGREIQGRQADTIRRLPTTREAASSASHHDPEMTHQPRTGCDGAGSVRKERCETAGQRQFVRCDEPARNTLETLQVRVSSDMGVQVPPRPPHRSKGT